VRRAEAERQVAEAAAVLRPGLRAGNPHAAELVRAARQAEAHLAGGLVGPAQRQEAERLLADLASQPLTSYQRGQLAIERSDTLRPLHRYTEATVELRAAAADVADGELRDRLVTALAKSLVFDGNVGDALDIASAVLANGTADRPAAAQAIWIASWALVLTGRASEALGVVDLRGRLGDRWKDEAPWLREMIESMRIAACLALGRIEEAAELTELSYRQSLRNQWSWGVKFWTLELMKVALAQGRVRTAVQWGQENLAQVPTAGDATLPYLNLVLPLVLAGDVEGAQAAFDKAEVSKISRSRLALLEVEQARRWISAAQGDLSVAINLALRAADLAQSMGVNDGYAAALHDAVRFGGAAQVADRLRTLAQRMDGPLVGWFAAHAMALTVNDGRALDEMATSFEAIGAMLFAAEASAEAAVTHRVAGHEQAFRFSAARTLTLAGRCEDARTPALRLLEQPPELTPREREIAGLAAAGLSNRVIAERLVVSVRTVGNHLQHVFDKLGVRSRRDLEALVDARGAPVRGRLGE
jgi:DNA-binding NarL/FixJ family response regulator